MMVTRELPTSEGCGELGNEVLHSLGSSLGALTHTHGTEQKIYYSERVQNKTRTEERYTGQSLEETRHKLPRILSLWSHTGRM